MVSWRKSEIGPKTGPANLSEIHRYRPSLSQKSLGQSITAHRMRLPSSQDEINSTGGFGALNLIQTFGVHSDDPSAISKTHPSKTRFLDVETPLPVLNTVVSTESESGIHEDQLKADFK